MNERAKRVQSWKKFAHGLLRGNGQQPSAREENKTQVWLNRRDVLRLGLAGAAAWLLESDLVSAAASARPAKAKAVIQIWMWGGPSHLDTFDPKPEAGYDYCGPLNKPIQTSVPGVRIGQLLPELAKLADKYAIIRSMTHGINAHETASYVVQTGHRAGGRDVFPCAGAVVSYFKGYRAGYKGMIPPYIVLTEPQGRFSEAGFLGTTYKPFATGGDPAKTPFVVEGIVAKGVTDQHQRNRRRLLQRLNRLAKVAPELPALQALARCDEQAYDMILGEGRKVWDLSTEKDSVRERYGRSTFGQSCLMARRLVERGVPYITINYKGWDTHKQHFQIMQRKLPELDKGFSALLEDLDARGLLDSTIVWWSGEFGRTPKILWNPPWNGGRGHWGFVFSAVVAGGGFQGGAVVGASDEKGMAVKDRPVYPWDLIAALYKQLGIDPQARLPHPEGLDVRVLSQKDLQANNPLEELT